MFEIKQYIALSLIQMPLWKKSDLLRRSYLEPYLNEFNDWTLVDKIYDEAVSRNVKILTPDSDEYPAILKTITDFPVILFCKGDISLLSYPCFASVGSRNLTSYGKVIVSRFIPTLIEAGFCIVSGLARGVDAEVHRVTLKHKGKTIAVLGSGVDVITPMQNKNLYDNILSDGGLIISEYPLGTDGSKWTFPQRNRIIAGLSQGVLVVEAGEKSGSLITASLATGYGRDVFAVPGPINSDLSVGVNNLLKRGAIIATEPEDILAQYNLLIKKSAKTRPELSDPAKNVLGMVLPQGVDLNELLLSSGIPMADLLKNLDELEHTGYIGKDNFGIYYLN
ncbi:MAG: DNA-processing protein DprA [Proteobacteria bacterium]|nr:DNA-processing protein DprA [Pseudomonadota bacterium]